MTATIYVITNMLNGKQYVGQTWHSIQRRWRQHCRDNRKPLGRSIRKHGECNFSIETVTMVSGTQADVDAAETIEISRRNTLMPNGYNIRLGGSAGQMHPDTRAKISRSHTGRIRKPPSAEWRANMSRAQQGKSHSVETRAKMSRAHQGTKSSAEACAKISRALRGRKRSDDTRAKISLSLKGNTNRSKRNLSDPNQSELPL